MNTLGVALYRTNNWTEAIETLQKTIELGSDNAHNWLFLAMSNWQLDNKPEARTWYEKSTIWRETNAARVEDDPELQAFFTEAETLLKNPKE